jgi:uncharacterized protein with HEPN domain
MVEAAETLGQFLSGRKREDLDHDRMLLFAVVRAIEILGEAAARVSEGTREGSPDVPWASIVGMRNRLVHGYFDVDTEIVWRTVSSEIPTLLVTLKRLL